MSLRGCEVSLVVIGLVNFDTIGEFERARSSVRQSIWLLTRWPRVQIPSSPCVFKPFEGGKRERI